MSIRTTCKRCGRPEASQTDWATVPDGERPDLCWGAHANCISEDEAIDRLNAELAMARQVSGVLCEKCGWAMKFPGDPCRCELAAELATAKERIAEYESVFALQRKRMAEADKRWQNATGNHNVMPDLGKLLEWLMADADAAKAQVAELRAALRDIADDSADEWAQNRARRALDKIGGAK